MKQDWCYMMITGSIVCSLFLFTSTLPLPGFIVCCVLISAPLALSNMLNVLSAVEVWPCVVSTNNRCFPQASCSEGKTITIGSALASRTVTILLARSLKRSPGPSESETLYLRGVWQIFFQAFTFFIDSYFMEGSDCMMSVCSCM